MADPLELPPAHLEWQRRRDAIAGRYARFYAPIAIAVTVLAFVPLFRDEVDLGDTVLTVTSRSLVGLAGSAAGPAAFALILLGALVALLVAASFGAGGGWLPPSIAGLAAVLLVMLLARPGFGPDKPGFTAAGVAAIVLAGWLLVLGLAHAIHLYPVGAQPARADDGDDEDAVD